MADQTLTFRLVIDGKESIAVLDLTKEKFVETGEAADLAIEQVKTSYKDLTGEALKLEQATGSVGINNLQSSLSGLSSELNNAGTFMDNFNRGNKALSENLTETIRSINISEKEAGKLDFKIKVNEAGFGKVIVKIAEVLEILDFVLHHIIPLFDNTEDLEKQKEFVKQLKEEYSKLYDEPLKKKTTGFKEQIKQLEDKYPEKEVTTIIHPESGEIIGTRVTTPEEIKSGKSRKPTLEERFGADYERYQKLLTELKSAKEALKDLGDIENTENKIIANLQRIREVNTENLNNYKDVIKVIRAENEDLKDTDITPQMVRDKIAGWIVSLLKESAHMFGALSEYTEDRVPGYFQEENLFDKRNEELRVAQRHAEVLLKTQTDNDDLMLLLKIKHFDEMIALYKKFGKDSTNLENQRLEAETKLTTGLSARGVDTGEKMKYHIIEQSNDTTEKLNQDHQKKLQKAAQLTTRDKLNLLMKEKDAVADSLGQISGMFSQHTLAYQAFAKAQALVDTYTAAQAAYKAVVGIPIVGPGLAIAAAIAATLAGLARVEKIGKVEIPQGKGFQEGGRLPKGKAGIFEGTSNEIVAPESDFKTYSAELTRQALIEARNYISVSSGASSPTLSGQATEDLRAIKTELMNLKQAIIDRPARAYLDDREAKKIVMKGGSMNRRSKI